MVTMVILYSNVFGVKVNELRNSTFALDTVGKPNFTPYPNYITAFFRFNF